MRDLEGPLPYSLPSPPTLAQGSPVDPDLGNCCPPEWQVVTLRPAPYTGSPIAPALSENLQGEAGADTQNSFKVKELF